MHKRLLASLIVCVALLTQLGASLWGAAAARDGYAGCHKSVAIHKIANAGVLGDTATPGEAPTPHDHASCFLCQLGFTAISSGAPLLPMARLQLYWRVAMDAPGGSPRPNVFNRNAPARAPPSLI
jgi:hypothetical protein